MHRLAAIAAAALLGACPGNDDPDFVRPEPPDFGTTPTGTVPDFLGRVPSNVLLISVDTLRRDHLPFHEPTAPALPTIDAHMATGFVATDHRTCSNWTFHGLSCALLGRDPVDIGVMPRLDVARAAWPDDTDALAGWFRDAGFYTVLASGNGWLSPTWGSAQGYDRAFGEAFDPAEPLYQSARSALTDAITAGEADRWLVHLHLMEPHAPYAPPLSYYSESLQLDPPPVDLDLNRKDHHYQATLDVWPELSEDDRALLEQHLRLRYAGEVRWLDDKLRDIFADLQIHGLLADTLIVFFTDHGEQFWERGHQSHAYNLNREENDGVWWFWAPNLVPGTWDGPTGQDDIAPTLLALYGLDVPPAVTGIPLGEAPADRPIHALTVARLGGAQAVVRDGWKLTFGWGGFARLYDLVADPDEADDVYAPDHPKVQELWPLIVERTAAAAALAPDQSVQAPPGLELP